jgi:hypothetical protein
MVKECKKLNKNLKMQVVLNNLKGELLKGGEHQKVEPLKEEHQKVEHSNLRHQFNNLKQEINFNLMH